jgi:hypothetical protein
MKNSIATGGYNRLINGQKELTMESLTKKYAEKIAAAPADQKTKIYEEMAHELDRQKNHKPSPYTLW